MTHPLFSIQSGTVDLVLGIDPEHPALDALTEAGRLMLEQCSTPRERELVWLALGAGFMEGVDHGLDPATAQTMPTDDDGLEVITCPFWVLRPTPTEGDTL